MHDMGWRGLAHRFLESRGIECVHDDGGGTKPTNQRLLVRRACRREHEVVARNERANQRRADRAAPASDENPHASLLVALRSARARAVSPSIAPAASVKASTIAVEANRGRHCAVT